MHSQVSTTDVEALVERMGRYLVEYETQLSTTVATEQYRQSATQFRSASLRGTVGNPIIRTRTLESEVVFLAHALGSGVDRRTADNELRVDFAINRALGILVPRALREEFELPGGGRFQGRASYSQFRRFTTSAKVIPPP